MQTTTEIKEVASTVFLKVDDGIYEVVKDRSGTFSGSLYANTQQVIDGLNHNLKAMILDTNALGIQYTKHKNF